MKGLAPRLERDQAWRKLSRRTLTDRLVSAAYATARRCPGGRLLPAAADRATAVDLPALETVWLPAYRVVMSARSASTEMNFDVLVNAHSGYVVIADLHDAEWLEMVAATTGPLAIAPGRALQLARQAAIRGAVSRPGWRRRAEVECRDEYDLIGYPVWAYYFATPTGMLDAKLLDAMSGAAGGPQLKTSLLATLAARQKHRQSGE